MDLSPVIIAIPMYFTLMAVELVYEHFSNKKTYRLHDAITNINTGVLQQLSGTFTKLIQIGVYILVYDKLAFFHIHPTWWSFVAVMIAWDFCYYWEHRYAHEISLFWGGHVVHHQSEDFNLSVALRQTSTGFIWGFPFFLPMALLGFDPKQFVIAGGFNLLYQFWIHTEHINKMPRWFEAVFNTPSHHRVHHGRDPKYIDKNYAGILIIWDRFFGTFQKEEERPTYGITRPLQSWNPVYANFAHYIDLFKVSRRAKSFRDVLGILFRKPGWLPDYLGGYQAPQAVPSTYQRYDNPSPFGINLYLLLQFAGALAFVSFYLFKNELFGPEVKIPFALWIVWTTLMFGFLFESDRPVFKLLEIMRLLSIPAGTYWIAQHELPMPEWAFYFAAGFGLLSMFAFFWVIVNTVKSPALFGQGSER